MDIYKQKWTKLQMGILRLLCIKTEPQSQRDIAKSLSVSPTAIGNALKGIGLVKVTKFKNASLVQLNIELEEAIAFKRVENLRMIYESGLIALLKANFPGCTIILFGSYSRGEDSKGSDIDIAIIGSERKEADLTRFERSFSRKIHLTFFKGEVPGDIKDSIINGIVLEGAL